MVNNTGKFKQYRFQSQNEGWAPIGPWCFQWARIQPGFCGADLFSNESVYLLSPVFDLTGEVNDPILTFDYSSSLSLQSGFNVEWRMEGSSNWTLLGDIGTGIDFCIEKEDFRGMILD